MSEELHISDTAKQAAKILMALYSYRYATDTLEERFAAIIQLLINSETSALRKESEELKKQLSFYSSADGADSLLSVKEEEKK